jgi:aquaglyceroporin related protein
MRSTYTTACVNTVRPGNGRNNTANTANTATTRMRRTGTSATNNTWNLNDAGDRAEKKQEQTVDIDNDYFALNPWYNQQKAKPVFGLAAPLPRTVRKGMWWGRGDLRDSLYKVDEQQDDVGVDRHDALDFQKEAGESSTYDNSKGMES